MCKFRNCNHSSRSLSLGFKAEAVSGTQIFPGTEYRLPQAVWPLHYEIELTPDFEHFTFHGQVAIDVDVRQATSQITLNARELKLGKAVVESADGTSLNGTVALDEELERAVISFNGTLGKGKWRLKVPFTGILNDELKGFYRSTWTDAEGKTHVIATTQFEATDARRAFPCFDEPEFKATFKVVLYVPHDYTALSAMRPVSISTMSVSAAPAELALHGHGDAVEPGLLKRVEFGTTPLMSTYYLAFMAGEFESGGTVMVNGKELGFWSIPGKSGQLKFAKGIAAFALAHYERYFNIPYYGGDKIDFIAIPDFAAGAMENLGCITYRQTDLLIDETTATQGELERVAHVVAHELAHMWFGDFTTMKWWNGLWLNESFATYMENKTVDLWRPEWKTWDTFARSRASAFGLDQLHSTHAIEVPVENGKQIDEIFDLISYEKGCSVLRMLEQYIGADAFRLGVQKYLHKHALSNTETHDLWDALEAACHEAGVDVPVRKLMDAWVFTSGHPVVTVSEGSMPGFIELSQKEFKVLNEEGTKQSNSLWPIPMVIKAATRDGEVERKLLFSGRNETVYVGEDLKWVVINAGGDGFFRVTYDTKLLGRVLANKATAMTQVDRYNLVNDAWACVRARLVTIEDFVRMVDHFGDETDANIWRRITGSLGYVYGVVDGQVKAAVQAKVVALLKPMLKKLGYAAAPTDGVKEKALRTTVIGALGTTGHHKPVIDKAAEMFAAWKKDPTSVDSNVFATMVYVLAENGGTELYKEFDGLRQNAATPQDAQRFMFALTSFTKPAETKANLDLVLSGKLRVQDASSFLSSLLGNEDAAHATWQAIKDNWDKITKMWPPHSVAYLFDSLSTLDTPELEADVRAFFAAHPVEGGQMKLAQGLEQLRINVLLRATVDDKLKQYLLPTQTENCTAPNPPESASKS